MLELDEATLARVGLESLDPAAKRRVLARLYDTLELLVGTRLSRDLSHEQISEFEFLIDNGREDESFDWLSVNRPDYKDVVRQSMDELLDVVAESVDDFKRSSWNAVR